MIKTVGDLLHALAQLPLDLPVFTPGFDEGGACPVGLERVPVLLKNGELYQESWALSIDDWEYQVDYHDDWEKIFTCVPAVKLTFANDFKIRSKK